MARNEAHSKLMESTGSQPALLSQKEAFARIRLLRSPHIGPVTFRQLLAWFGAAERSLEALPDLGSGGKRTYRAAPVDRIEREVDAVRRAGRLWRSPDRRSMRVRKAAIT